MDNVFFSGEKKPEDKAEEIDVSPTEKSAKDDVETADETADELPLE